MDIRNILFRNISQITPPAFGVDISDLSVKIAFLRKYKREIKLESFGRKEIPQGIVREGKIQKKNELSKIIKEAVREVRGKKLKTKYVISSLPEQHAFVRIIQLPKMKLIEAKEAVKWETEANIPMSIDEVYMDWQIVKPIGNHLDILINAVPKNLVNDYAEVLEGAGLKPMVLEVESMATIRSLIKEEVSQKPVFIIDLGATRTSFIIFSGQAARFTTSVSISNQQMIGAIAEGLGITRKKAWELKVKLGLGGDKKDNKILSILFPILNNLGREIEKHITFYQEHTAPHKRGSAGEISKIILCGGGANLAGLPRFLSERLKIPVVCGNPWVNILKPPIKEIPELSYRESLTYATALGLALRGMPK